MKLSNRSQFLTLFALVIAASVFLFSCAKTAQAQKRPNVIFIITDDQQTGLLGIEGNPVAQTPNIDRIGKEGVIFKNAFVVTPLCSPSRARGNDRSTIVGDELRCLRSVISGSQHP